VSRRPRVLIAHHSAVLGGTEASLRTHLEWARACDYALALPDPGWGPRSASIVHRARLAPPVSYRGVDLHGAPLRIVTSVVTLTRLIRRLNPDLIVAYASMSMPVVAAAAKLTRSPCLWHAREIMARRFPARAFARACSRIVVPSERMARILEARISHADGGKIVVIPSPIDPDAYSPPPSISSLDKLRSDLGLPASGRFLLMVGQHVPWKGHLDLIQAFPLIRKHVPDVRLILVGGPWTKADRSHSRRLREGARDLAERDLVHFRPPSPEVERHYWAADLLVLPSRAEPFGRVALEAMAAGLPVVVSEDAGVAPAVAQLSPDLLAKPGDPRALAETVVGALMVEPDVRREWIERGRALVRRSFSAETVVPAIERVYLDAIG